MNPADLFTKHLESKAKLDQVVGLFSCRFIEWRAASAPTLKSADAAVYVAHDPLILPHLHLPEDIASLFEEAVPEPPRRGEDDVDPVDELRDPVPALQALMDRHRIRASKRTGVQLGESADVDPACIELVDSAGTGRDHGGRAPVDTVEPR